VAAFRFGGGSRPEGGRSASPTQWTRWWGWVGPLEVCVARAPRPFGLPVLRLAFPPRCPARALVQSRDLLIAPRLHPRSPAMSPWPLGELGCSRPTAPWPLRELGCGKLGHTDAPSTAPGPKIDPLRCLARARVQKTAPLRGLRRARVGNFAPLLRPRRARLPKKGPLPYLSRAPAHSEDMPMVLREHRSSPGASPSPSESSRALEGPYRSLLGEPSRRVLSRPANTPDPSVVALGTPGLTNLHHA